VKHTSAHSASGHNYVTLSRLITGFCISLQHKKNAKFSFWQLCFQNVTASVKAKVRDYTSESELKNYALNNHKMDKILYCLINPHERN